MKKFAVSLALFISIIAPARAFSEDALTFRRPELADDLQAASQSDADPVVRQEYARGLGESGSLASIPALSGMVQNDPDEGVRLAAMGALLTIGDRSAMPAYLKAMKDRSEKVRQSAAEALSGQWDREGHKALLSALRNDPSSKVRKCVVIALGNPGIMGMGGAHNWDMGDETQNALIQALGSDTSYEVRANAAEALGLFDDGAALDPLIAALTGDKSTAVRAAAAESLGAMNRPEAVAPLLDVVSFEKDESIVVNALKSLKYYDDPRVAGPAIKSLRSASPKVRWQAIDVIEMLRPKDAVRPLKEIARDWHEEEGTRVKAKEALQIMGEDEEEKDKD